MQEFKNFLSPKLYNKFDNLISNINVEDLENIFDISYEKKSTELLECIPLRIHKGTSIVYKALFICKNILDEFRNQIRKNLGKYQSKRIIFQVCIWDQGSSLGMHYDKIYKYGGTLYFNDWDEMWGGLLEYRTNSGKIETICPQKNLFVFNDFNEEHQVTMINKESPEKRKSMQVWMLD